MRDNWTRELIVEQIAHIAAQQHKLLAPLTDDLPLLETGLDSLCVAILVATLDDRMGIDPFSGDGVIGFPVTVGDFIRAYENATA